MTNKLYAKNHFFRPTVQKVNRTRAVIVSVIRQSMHRLSKAEKNTKKRRCPNGTAPPPSASRGLSPRGSDGL